jgi:DNA repair exonuclease SbcCD nuclease subunit
MARILTIGDVHIKTSNIPVIDILTEKIVKLAEEQKPDLIVLLGDVFDTFEKMYIVPQKRGNDLVRKLRKIASVFTLVGNHDMTCVGKNTPILLYNGTTKLSQKIKKGDILTGDDNKPRHVKRVWKGTSELYQIQQSNGMTYTVTPNHKLCLKSRHHRRLTWNETESKCEISWFEGNSLETKVFDSHDGNKRYSKQDLIRISESYLDYVAPNNVIEMTVHQLYSVLSADASSNLCGYKISVNDPNDYTLSDLTVTKLPTPGKYYGIEVDGNNRYLLGDRTVTHNCNQQFLTDEHSLNALKDWENVTVVDTVITRTIKGAQLVFVPYVPPGRFIEALNTIGDKWKTADCIFAHQELFNCKMGNINSTEGDKWNIKNPFVCSGHIHLKQHPQKNIYYPGSSTQVSFGENEDKIIALLTITSRKPVDIKEFSLDLPKKKIVYLDVENLEEYTPPENTKDDIKVSVSGSYDQFKALKKTKKYKELEQQGLQVVFKPKKLKKVNKIDISPAVDSSVDFNEILVNMITAKKDPYLYQAYEHVVNNNPIEEDSVMFL